MGHTEASIRAMRFGVFDVDLRARELRRSGVRLKLQDQPFQVLVQLLERPGEVVTREELRQSLWPDDTFVDFDHGLNTAVNRLRETLGDVAGTSRFIETIPRRGYRFIAPVEAVDEDRPGTEPAPTTPTRSWRIWAAFLSAVVLLGAAGYLARREMARPVVAPAHRVMLAVLPFENLSGDPDQDYFSDGLTEEIITRLGMLQPTGLGVIARTSAMKYKNTQKDLEEISRELGVGYLLEGTVRKEGERVRITTSLVQANDRSQLWAQSYDRQMADIFSVQEDVAQSVAQSLAVELLPRQRQAEARQPTTTPAAYEAYLRGRYFSRQGLAGPSRKYFEEATALDPNFAPAYAGLASSLLFDVPALETMPKARDAALKALDLDPSLPEAYSGLGSVKLMFGWDWKGAESAFKQSLALDSSDPETYLRYSNYLAAMGHLDEAIATARRAQQLDPLAPLPRVIIGRYLTFQGRLDDALAEYQETLALDPHNFWGHVFISFAYEQKGDYDHWAEHQVEAWRSGGTPEAVLDKFSAAYRRGGYEAMLRALIAVREAKAARGIISSVALSLDYLKLGEKEKALYWLQKTYENHTRDLIYLNVERQFDPIRNDPRFQEIVRRIGLPPPRRETATR